jgi:SAM-dependent methyltransferase
MSEPFPKNHFGRHAPDYRRFRPSYPPALFDFLAATSAARELAWDAATGNGQAALGLAAHFSRVVATDASPEQVAEAKPHPKVSYRVCRSEESGLDRASVDVVTVAQALHWFDLERFYDEVRRVVRPDGIVALWCYTMSEITPEIDRRIGRFYSGVVGPYWPGERKHIESRYETLPFPFAEIAAPRFAIDEAWDLGRLLGYIDTWSAVQRFRRARGVDPLEELAAELADEWGPPERIRPVRFPLYLRCGRVTSSSAPPRQA